MTRPAAEPEVDPKIQVGTVQNALFINRLIEDGYPVLSEAVGMLDSIGSKLMANMKGIKSFEADVLKYP